jgi:hypothetical protein
VPVLEGKRYLSGVVFATKFSHVRMSVNTAAMSLETVVSCVKDVKKDSPKVGMLLDMKEHTSLSNVTSVEKHSHRLGILWLIKERILANSLSDVSFVVKDSLKREAL